MVRDKSPEPNPWMESLIRAAAESELARAAASVRADGGQAFALGDSRVRPLFPEEVARLEGLGNTCDDWTRVRVAVTFDWRRVRQCHLQGDVVLGHFRRYVPVADGVELPAGVYQSTLAHCVVGHDALVRDVKLLANYVIGPEAVVWDCGRVVGEGSTVFGNGAALSLGNENGGREVPVYAELPLEAAAALVRSPSRQRHLKHYAALVLEYVQAVRSPRGIVARGAVVRGSRDVRNAYVGPHAVVDGATLLADSTLLSNAEEPTRVLSGACVSGSLLQWGSRAATHALVERSVLMEHAHAERHGKVADSVIGPNTGVAEGEVTASLLGPFVGFHHQALAIAVLWPEGKGNVSSGAQVGSNHTSKAPDQEFWPGEGLFLGLGVNVKFPSDFRGSPYSLVACGVTTLPQKVDFPFALINAPSVHRPDVPPAFNEIAPAWFLTDNLYAVKRNEGKYRKRNQARRTPIEFDVFRPDTVELMRDACRRLEAVVQPREVYTERDVAGLGKNYLTESARRRAVDGYRFFVRYYALLGLMDRARAALEEGPAGAVDALLTTPAEGRWEHQRGILVNDLGLAGVEEGLRQLPELLEHVAREVERSKRKDDERGRRIIDDYADTHPDAARDAFVQQTWRETRRLQEEVVALLDRLGEAARGHRPARRAVEGAGRHVR